MNYAKSRFTDEHLHVLLLRIGVKHFTQNIERLVKENKLKFHTNSI